MRGSLLLVIRFSGRNIESWKMDKFIIQIYPWISGIGWFLLFDQPYTVSIDDENYQIGFITVGDYPNQEIVVCAREVGLKMYAERYGNN